MKPVCMADVAARHAEVSDQIERRVLEVLRSGRYVGGPQVREAERLAARWFGRADAVGVASGTDALMLALQAAGVRPGAEVIVPALTFFATAGAVLAIGARPVVVDVLEDACMDPDAAARARTHLTAAVIPVHLFGNLAPAPDLGVPVIDDAAQAIGGRVPRSNGVLTTLSTYPTKVWGGAGEGGFVVGDRAELLERVRRLGNHGLGAEPDLHFLVSGVVGRNSRLDAVQAAVLVANEPRIQPRVEHRRALASRYDAGLPAGARPLPRDDDSPVHQYLVLVEDRGRVQAHLAARQIESRVYYPLPLHHQPALLQPAHTPVAEQLCTRLLALPIHRGMDDADVDRVLTALHEVVSS